MSVGINLISRFNADGIKKAIAEFKALETSSAKAQFALKKAALPAAAALTGLAFAARHAAKAAMEDQASQAAFANVLKNVTGLTEGQVQAINDSITAMSMQTGITDDQLRPAFQSLVVATGSVSTAQKDMALAMDISAATGKDLETVTAALGKAHNGVTKGLVALDPSMKKVLGTTKDFTVIQDLLTQKFGGAEAAFEKTAAGGMRKFQNSVDEMWEAIGNNLLPVMNAIMPILAGFANWAKDHATFMVALAAGVAVFSVAILAAVAYLKIMAIWEAITNALNPFFWIVAGVVALIAVFTVLVVHFGGIKNAFATVANFMISAFEKVVNLFIMGANKIIDGINKLIKAANYFGAGLPVLGHIGEVSFGRIAIAAGQSAKAISASADRLTALAVAYGVVGKKGDDSFGGTGKTVETAAEKIKKYTDALKSETDAEKSAADAAKSVLKAQTDLIAVQEKLSVAQKNFNNISKGYGANSKEAAAQTKIVAQAQRDLVKANTSAMDATNALAAAEAYLKKLREKPAAITMENGEIGLEKAKLNAEKATFDVLDAERELADLRTTGDATPEAIRKAEISLQEAKYSQRDATLAVTDAEAALKKLREDTPTAEEIAAAERNVADAKLAVEEAIIAQQDATQKVNDENLLYTQIVSGAAEDTDIFKEALKQLNDARKDEVDAIDNVTQAKDRELEATLKLAEAEQALLDVKGKVGAKIVATGNKQQAAALAAAQAKIGATNNAASSTTLTAEQMDALAARRVGFAVPFFADGGVVNGATLAVVGEKGAEAIIPLDQLGGMGGNTYITVNAGMGTDGAEVGKQIIDAIKKAERRSGKVFASA